MVTYKQRCGKCRKNWVLMSWRSGFPICYDCQKHDLEGEIHDPAMQKLFAIPEQLYRDSSFLRDIKKRYLLSGTLSEKQIAAFKKVTDKLSGTSEKIDDDGNH